MFFGALFAGMLAVVIIIIFVIHGIVDQFRSCLGNMAFIYFRALLPVSTKESGPEALE